MQALQLSSDIDKRHEMIMEEDEIRSTSAMASPELSSSQNTSSTTSSARASDLESRGSAGTATSGADNGKGNAWCAGLQATVAACVHSTHKRLRRFFRALWARILVYPLFYVLFLGYFLTYFLAMAVQAGSPDAMRQTASSEVSTGAKLAFLPN